MFCNSWKVFGFLNQIYFDFLVKHFFSIFKMQDLKLLFLMYKQETTMLLVFLMFTFGATC